MSDIYKEKEWEVRKILEETPNIPVIFENYVEEVDRFIDYQIKCVIEERNENYLLKQKLEGVQKEIIRLNNIINELEKYINENYIYDEVGMKIFDASTLQDKLQELKGSDKE